MKGDGFLKYDVVKAACVLLAGICIVALPFLYAPDGGVFLSASAYIAQEVPIILDAGHGGEDGGAIGVGGILEKDINLSVTLKINAVLRFFGYQTLLTRSKDEMTCDDGLSSQRAKKVSDIKNRFALLENTGCLCFISIHQNFFGGNAHGAQIFYSGGNEQSKLLAQALQDNIRTALQPENSRVIKQATDDIYILYHTKKPAVLAECGFISNSGDAAMLTDENYQNKLAFVIAESTAKYLSERGK